MSFVNIKNGTVSVDSFRLPEAKSTDIPEIINAYTNKTNETLTASIDLFVKLELAKLDLSSCGNRCEAFQHVFGEYDFLDFAFTDLDLDISDYAELRDYQNDYVENYFTKKKGD